MIPKSPIKVLCLRVKVPLTREVPSSSEELAHRDTLYEGSGMMA